MYVVYVELIVLGLHKQTLVDSFTHPLTQHIHVVSNHIKSKSGSEYCVRVFMFVHMHKVLLVFVSVYKVNEHVSSVYTCPASASDPTTASRVEQETLLYACE